MKFSKGARDHVCVTLIAMVLLWVCSLVTMNLSFFSPMKRALSNFSLSDIYYQMLKDGGKSQHNDIITIIDATTLYDRGKIGELFMQVAECNPAAVGIDCIYGGLRGDTLGSEVLAEGVFTMDNPVFAFKLREYDVETGKYQSQGHSFFAPMEGLQEGYSNVSYDVSGTAIRKFVTMMEMDGDTVYSLPFQIARQYGIDTDEMLSDKPRLIDYYPTEFTVVPWDSIEGNEELLRDHIVFIGATNDDSDMHFSPFGRQPGTVIQAYILQNILEHKHVEAIGFLPLLLISFLIIILTDVMQTELAKWSQKQENLFLRFILDTALVKNLINFMWIAILVYINFIVFMRLEVYFDPTITLVSIALLVEARLFYTSATKAYSNFRALKK